MNMRLSTWSAALILGALASSSFSQSNSQAVTPYRQLSTGSAIVMNTADFSPQIKQRNELTPRPSSPNESPAPYMVGPANSLKAGSVTTKNNNAPRAKFPGITFTGFVPPDPDLAVGPNHVVAVVNSDLAFFTKSTGAKTFQQSGDGNGFFTGIGVQSNFTFDPKCYFDKLSQRFFVIFLELDEGAGVSKVLVAVSDDADPNGTWFKYRIEAKVTEGSNTWWLDYPGLAVNKDALVISGNMFPITGSGVFTSIIVIPKAPLLTGANATASYLKDTTMFTFQPARSTDASSSVMYGASAVSSTVMRLAAITNLTGTPTMVKKDVAIPSWLGPNNVPAGGGRFLDGFEGRLYNAHFRGGRLVTAHNTRAADGRMKARWYEFSVETWPTSGNPLLRQSGDILLSGTNTCMPAINTNSAGDISIIYTRSNGSTNPETCISSRFATDPLGTMGAPTVLATSAGTYGGVGVNRWGDYFGCEIDPVDNLTFWGIGMVGAAGGLWTTHINKWNVSTGSAGTLINPIGVTFVQGTFLAGDLNSITASDNSRYETQSILIDKNGNQTFDGVNATGQATSFQVDFDLDLSAGTLSDLKAVVEAHAVPTGATGQVFAWNWTTGTFKSIASFGLTTADKTNNIAIPRTALSSYVGGTGNVRLLIRAFAPIRGGRPNKIPAPFAFNVDRVALAPAFTP